MMVANFVKDPQAVLDYYLDWTDWVVPGDSIVTSTWVMLGGTVTLSQDAILGTFTTVWAAGGTAGEIVELLNHIVTAEGREDERTIELILRD